MAQMWRFATLRLRINKQAYVNENAMINNTSASRVTDWDIVVVPEEIYPKKRCNEECVSYETYLCMISVFCVAYWFYRIIYVVIITHLFIRYSVKMLNNRGELINLLLCKILYRKYPACWWEAKYIVDDGFE